MRVSWFNWRGASRSVAASPTTTCAPRPRNDAEIDLALCLIPHYQVRLQVDNPFAPQRIAPPASWLASLTETLGAERAQQALAEFHAQGAAVLAVCPLELAEHYCVELARLALPCRITPA
jgi:hypothetical protein